MRYAKKKSFRLNRILRRMFEQSFEEIADTSVVVVVVVVVVVHRFNYHVEIRFRGYLTY